MIELDSDGGKGRPCLTSRLRKVYYGYHDYRGGGPHPMIRFQGKYLHELGFNIGDPIEVDLTPGCITIRRKVTPAVFPGSGDKGKTTKQAQTGTVASRQGSINHTSKGG